MSTVTVSPKFKVVIPRDMRRRLHIQPGQKLMARVRDGRIELIPELPMTAARGFLPGLDTRVERV
jgi:AbrB family looped-hinge helix DNA binding protein